MDKKNSEKTADELIDRVNEKTINMEAKKKPATKKTPQKQPPHDALPTTSIHIGPS